MTKSDFQIQHTCYTHVKSCVYLCIVQGSTLVNTITGIIPITILPNLTGITNISWNDVSQVSFLSENGVNYKAVGDLSDQTSLQLNTTDQGSVQDLISDQSLYNVTWSVIFTDFQTEESTVLVSGKIAHEVSFIADQIGEYYRVIFLK